MSAAPRCPHYGLCGGCQLQDVAYPEQLRLKQASLSALLQQAGVAAPAISVHSSEPWRYRNRIRLRLARADGVLRFGYNRVNTIDFLPIFTCPISQDILVQTAEALLHTASVDGDGAFWANAATEVELFCNADASSVQMTLHCAPRTRAAPGSLARMLQALQIAAPWTAGLASIASDPRTGPTGRTLDHAGAPGLAYRTAGHSYWVSRGGFFQVNRFLIDTLVDLVCTGRSGTLAWDLFAGVGLFSLVLASNFDRIAAVEANPTAMQDLRSALAKRSPRSTAVQATTLDFLTRAVLDRDRPELIVLDPPRAGAGTDACALLLRLAAQQIVYVSCDPSSLARDLAVLASAYEISALHLVDLFPQTTHLETVAILAKTK